jgi:hypothetical protein
VTRKTVKGTEAQREEQQKGADEGGKELTFSNIKLKKKKRERKKSGAKGSETRCRKSCVVVGKERKIRKLTYSCLLLTCESERQNSGGYRNRR